MTNGLYLAAARTLASLTLALEGHVTLKIVIYVKNRPHKPKNRLAYFHPL